MKTYIKSIHEEAYSDDSKTLGVLYNYTEDEEFTESFLFLYREGMYIIFDTMIDMFDYLLYGEKKMKRAYMEEDIFDRYYDADFIDGKFTDILEWTQD